jgi:hypothetical protein
VKERARREACAVLRAASGGVHGGCEVVFHCDSGSECVGVAVVVAVVVDVSVAVVVAVFERCWAVGV